MYTLGIPETQFRRTTSILNHNRSNFIEHDFIKQDDGFYLFSFDVDYDGFKNIVILLKKNGVSTIGADDQLTQGNIMKLTNILKEREEERPNRMENAEDVIVMVDEIITDNPDTALDLLEDMVEDFYENQSIDRPDTNLQEIKKVKNIIQNIIKEWRK